MRRGDLEDGGGAAPGTVRVARRRFVRRQWSRRWRTWRGLLMVLLALCVTGGVVWLLYFSSVLTVTQVRVEGIRVLGAPDVRLAAAVPTGTPLARVDVDAVAARVEGLAPVAEVDVSRSWPDTVRVAVTEREAVAVVAREDSFRGLDRNGVLFRAYPTRPADLPLLRIRAGTRTEALEEAAAVVVALPEDLDERLEHVEVATVDAITLHLTDGRSVFWGSAEQSADKARVVEALLARPGRVYDVSVPGQPTLRR